MTDINFWYLFALIVIGVVLIRYDLHQIKLLFKDLNNRQP